MTTLAVPHNSAKMSNMSIANRRGIHRPLSNHGMPKAPAATATDRFHRFSGSRLASPTYPHDSTSLRSPGPMSPPMSAKSFGTFIDSEPSTPAYSPRMDYDWDSSTLVLLRPMSSSSAPSSPIEPTWSLVTPLKTPPQQSSHSPRPENQQTRLAVEQTMALTALHPIKKVKSPKTSPVKLVEPVSQAKPVAEVKVTEHVEKEAPVPQRKDSAVEPVAEEKEHNNNASAPLNKLASKMKSMLRRRSAADPKKDKKQKEYYDVDRVENVHWTEM